MNKAIAVVGFTVLSAAIAHAQYAPGLSSNEKNKDWTLAASLRGFYDDNYLTQPTTTLYAAPGGGFVTAHPRVASWGTEAIPSVAWNHSAESTLLSISYVYDVRWYENHSTTDQTHQLNAGFQKEFTEGLKLSVNESFVVAQEPTVIDQGVVTSPLRVEGNNIRNTGTVNLTDSLTKTLDLHVGYNNTLYDYPQLADSVIGYPFTGPESTYTPSPSRSALLNRMEHLATLDLRWKITPSTTGLLGYEYGQTTYTSHEYINYPYGPGVGAAYATPPGQLGSFKGDYSNVRNDMSHYLFLGADEEFSETIHGAIRAGAQYIDYYNAADEFGNHHPTDRVSPYVDASITDQYQQGAVVMLGVKHLHNSTDVVGASGNIPGGGTLPVLDEQSTAIYLSDTHKVTDRLTFTALGQAQLSSFTGGGPEYAGKMDQFFTADLRFAYAFNPWWSAEAGYVYSRLKSDLPFRAYSRDFMYLGVRATY